MPLKGLNVLEFSGLAPAPFVGTILSDFGANVTVIQNVSTLLRAILLYCSFISPKKVCRYWVPTYFNFFVL